MFYNRCALMQVDPVLIMSNQAELTPKQTRDSDSFCFPEQNSARF